MSTSRIPLISFNKPSPGVTGTEGVGTGTAEVEESSPATSCGFELGDSFEAGPRKSLVNTTGFSSDCVGGSCETGSAGCILPRGRGLDDTISAGRRALEQHIEQDLFGGNGPLKDADPALKDEMMQGAQSWTPEGAQPFETFDPKEQGYETQIAGHPFTVTFTQGWKTARALMTDA